MARRGDAASLIIRDDGTGLDAATLARLSGPGSTNFTPDNTFGSIGVQFANPARFFEVQLGAAAADGGEFITPPPTMLSDEQWAELTREFLANS